MKISRFRRRIHDPWGNKFINKYGQVIGCEYMIGQSEIIGGRGTVDNERYLVDRTLNVESNGRKFIKTGRSSVEQLRR